MSGRTGCSVFCLAGVELAWLLGLLGLCAELKRNPRKWTVKLQEGDKGEEQKKGDTSADLEVLNRKLGQEGC